MDVNELSPEQKRAFQKFVAGKNIFVTGPGGTGKSRLIKHLVEHSISTGKHIDICAMTGCAAILLQCNAKTIHSWSGIKLAKGDTNSIISKVTKSQTYVSAWKKARILVLDEVSMLSKKIFELLDEIARRVRRNSLPFGGIQVVFAGDFFQLPPIGTDGDPDSELFCFETPLWNSVFKPENIIELTTMFRQKDPLYIDILSQIRRGYLEEDKRELLKQYVGRKYDPSENSGCYLTKLFAIRSKTDYVNNNMFSQLKEKEYVYEVSVKKDCYTYLDSTKPIESAVLRSCSQMTAKEVEYETDAMINSMPCSQVVRLKKGAAVMCTVNIDMERGICNGSQGIILDMVEMPIAQKNNGSGGGGGGGGSGGTAHYPVVKFANGLVMTIQPHFWQSENIPTICVGQIPLCLAWALTIHKMQGATLSMAEIDIGYSIFEYGQSYVALSRIQALEGLYLTSFDPNKIKANPKVIQFYRNILAAPSSSTEIVDFSRFMLKEPANENVKIVKLR